MNKDGSPVPTHRVAWELVNGPIPGGLHVLHRCDNRKCQNPAHLFLGTNSDNIADKVAKGRAPKGADNAASKLTAEQIGRILADPRLHREIALEFGIHRAQVSIIKRGKTWKHLSGTLDPRTTRGSRVGTSKLTELQIPVIRVDTRPTKDIAAQYGVSTKTINQIKARSRWRWLP